ncbi:MAG: hypothetical protein CfClM3_0441 [Methanobrevibacter sp. CfCl-M3]
MSLKNLIAMFLVVFMTAMVINGANAAHSLTVQSQGWTGNDCGLGNIEVIKTDGTSEITKISPGETKTVDLPGNINRVAFNSDGRKGGYNANLKNLQSVFTLFSNADFKANVWFYSKGSYDNKMEFVDAANTDRCRDWTNPWKAVTIGAQSRIASEDGNIIVKAINIDNTNTDILSGDGEAVIPATVNRKTIRITDTKYDSSVEIPMYLAPKDIIINKNSGAKTITVKYNGKSVTVDENQHSMI